MEAMQVKQKIEAPTEWVSSLTIVEKSNSQLHICLDPRDLNKAKKGEHFKLPTRKEIMAQFANAQYFSKLDASSGFWQLKVTEESSKLCTFNTPFGRYRFLQLPFGIPSAPELYHKTVYLIYEHINGVHTSRDDFVIWGSTKEEHNHKLWEVLHTTRAANLRLNREKRILEVTELTFVWDIISNEGVKPDKRKISATEMMPCPKSKKDVQQFLGMVNYLRKFKPNCKESNHFR
ncbi:unnamed protein product [Caretta caretta]